MIGAGISTAGTSGAGLGAPVIPDGPATATGGARALDYRTGLPTVDPDTGAFVRVDSVAQRVYLAVRTTIGSSGADQTLGAGRPRKMGSRFEAEHSALILAALDPLVREGAITVGTITVNRLRPGAYTSTIEFFNRITRKRDQVTV